MSMKIYEIIPGKLYQSKKTHDEPDKLASIKALGINVIVNLWHSSDEDLVDEVDKYFNFPMKDGKEVDLEYCETVASIIVKRIKKGYVVLVHCYGGRNRSGLINAFVIRQLRNLTGKEARKFIISKRPNSLVNKQFSKVLDSLDKPQV
jgi:protein-tyrosine phosphatase